MVRAEEQASLGPIALLALAYFTTDILTFNRLETFNGCITLSRQQVVVLLALYPVWIFLTWIENLATYRGDVVVMTLVGTANTVVGYATTVFVLNNRFSLERQQWGGLAGRFVVNGLWRWNNYLVYSAP